MPVKSNIYRQDNRLAASDEISKRLLFHYERKLEPKFGKLISFISEKRVPFQHKGIDRRLFFSQNGKITPITVEEKIRRKYKNDILLEFVSDDRVDIDSPRHDGWIHKNLECDFIVFYSIDIDHFSIYNWEIFKKTYQVYGAEWIQKAVNKEHGFRIVYAVNKRCVKGENLDYKSHSLIVPKQIFIEAYKEVYSTSSVS